MTPAFLSALGLGIDCDDRALRRVYAQRLKQIDAASDPQAFQALRDAYEAAQAWLNRRSMAESAPRAGSERGPAVDAPSSEANMDPSEAVFSHFLTRVQAGFDDLHQARHALDEALADNALINLDARAMFEARVGVLLMNGWQPGHEFLFPAAAECFQWDRDRAKLRVYGQLGVAVDAAVREWQMFVRQPSYQNGIQRRLIKDLRTPEVPEARKLRAEGPLVFQLFEHYPNWMRSITSFEQAKRWHAAFEALPPVPAEAGFKPMPASALPFATKRQGLPLSWIGWGVTALVSLLLVVISPTPKPNNSLPPLTTPAGNSKSPWQTAPGSASPESWLSGTSTGSRTVMPSPAPEARPAVPPRQSASAATPDSPPRRNKSQQTPTLPVRSMGPAESSPNEDRPRNPRTGLAFETLPISEMLRIERPVSLPPQAASAATSHGDRD